MCLVCVCVWYMRSMCMCTYGHHHTVYVCRYCICRQLYHGQMVGCDTCDDWFHFYCINLSPTQVTNVITYSSCIIYHTSYTMHHIPCMIHNAGEQERHLLLHPLRPQGECGAVRSSHGQHEQQVVRQGCCTAGP
ncbi:hypothetical protein EON63_24540 [archaeon]|nr:MAG: hypothetical protein EON63_24540 [archaeon]